MVENVLSLKGFDAITRPASLDRRVSVNYAAVPHDGGVLMQRLHYGNIEQLPSGNFRVRYLGPDGTRRTAPDTFRTRKNAGQWLSRTHAAICHGSWVDPELANRLLADYAKLWMSQAELRGKPLAVRTVETYEHSLEKWILPFLGRERLSAISPPIIRGWHAHVRTRTGPGATRTAYSLLRAILNTAVADEMIDRNPCRIVGAGQSNSSERPLLSLPEVERLIAAMPPHLTALTGLTFWAHLRLGEVLGLQPRDIDLGRGILRIERQQVETNTVPSLLSPKRPAGAASTSPNKPYWPCNYSCPTCAAPLRTLNCSAQ